jgi:uncharacterized protein with GYD domain
MATYIILSRWVPEAFAEVDDFKKAAATVSAIIRDECRGVTWKASYATMGRFDAVDIVESDDPNQIKKIAMIIRTLGRSTTETLQATPWADFLAMF